MRDEELKAAIVHIHAHNRSVYGAYKVWKALRRAGVDVGRDRVARLMRSLGLQGVHRGKKRRTTTPGPEGERPSDLVERQFVAFEPNRLWVADLERHEALLNPAVMKGHRPWLVAASR